MSIKDMVKADVENAPEIKWPGFVDDKTRLGYWFPKLKAAGLPVPITSDPIVAVKDAIIEVYDEKKPDKVLELVEGIKREADKIGYPCFLRTDYTAGKHEWNETCYVTGPDKILRHVAGIMHFAECCTFEGYLGLDKWYVREYLPIKPYGVCKKYNDMPICREYRFFVNEGNIECWHPYWPDEALERGRVEWGDIGEYYSRKILSHTELYEQKILFALASKAGKALGGHFSIDILDTEMGWYITDCALAQVSWHWPDCSNNPKKRNG